MDNRPSLLVWHSNQYLEKLLNWRQIIYEPAGAILKVQGFDNYNQIVNLNKVFSSMPQYYPVDRTGLAKTPWRQKITRPWQKPTQQWTLEQAMSARVASIENLDQPINVFWSGGIDSTAAVSSFLKNLNDRSRLRILYTPWSMYEHPAYFKFLNQFPEVEQIDISGEVYINEQFDGIFISGDGGDEYHASLDESFFERHGVAALYRPWPDFFREQGHTEALIEFCEQHFAQAGRPIDTVLDARWWFYASCKESSILLLKLARFFGYDSFDPSRLYGFYVCDEYENYIYWNSNDSLIGQEYHNWKQNLKNYCYDFDGFADWRDNKTKYHSQQLDIYQRKKIFLKDQHWIAILEDGSRITTPGMPVLTQREFVNCYGNSLDYIFNEPDKI